MAVRTPIQDARFQVTVTRNKVERLTAQLEAAQANLKAAEAKVSELEAAELNELAEGDNE